MTDWRAFWQFNQSQSKAIDAAIIGLGFALIESQINEARYPPEIKREILARIQSMREGMTG